MFYYLHSYFKYISLLYKYIDFYVLTTARHGIEMKRFACYRIITGYITQL